MQRSREEASGSHSQGIHKEREQLGLQGHAGVAKEKPFSNPAMAYGPGTFLVILFFPKASPMLGFSFSR